MTEMPEETEEPTQIATADQVQQPPVTTDRPQTQVEANTALKQSSKRRVVTQVHARSYYKVSHLLMDSGWG